MHANHVRQLVDVLVSLAEEEGETLVLLLINEFAVALLVFSHKTTQTLFFYPFLLLLLFTLRVGVPGQDGLVDLLYLGLVVLVPSLHLSRMREHGIEILLMLLSAFSLGLNPLLFLQPFRGSGLPEALSLGPFVCLNVDGRLQRGVSASAGHHLGP